MATAAENGQPPGPSIAAENANGSANGVPIPKRPTRPNYRKIHGRPLPVLVYALPSFQPHNPLSLLPVIYNILRDYFSPRSSHPESLYQAHFSSRTRSVHVTNTATVRALWEMGFFGKGTLSRSEPNWLDMERRRLGLVAFETSEEFTARRRKERDDFKKERARIERELVEEQRQKEADTLSGGLETPGPSQDGHETPASTEPVIAGTRARENLVQRRAQSTLNRQTAFPSEESRIEDLDDTEDLLQQDEPTDQEHLQLSLVESFFLTYGLGVLQFDASTAPQDSWNNLQLFRQHSYFPPMAISGLQPDDPFLLSYVVYHHFRSLGWVVRDGIKFAVDWLLYERGPVFTHSTFAVMILPSYSDQYWHQDPVRSKEVARKRAKKNWHWFHCASRVQNQVMKKLVLVYVDVPSPEKQEDAVKERDVGMLLRSYKIREFCVQRWSPNRNRD